MSAEPSAVYRTEVGRAYVQIADLTECTIDALYAVDVAEWAVTLRHPIRNRIHYLLRGYTSAQWQAQAIREHFAHMGSASFEASER